MPNSILFKMKYKDTDFTREYEFNDVSDEAILIETVRAKVVAINESLAGGQADTLANLFVSDDYDSQEQVGSLENIYDLKIKVTSEVDIPQTSSINRMLEMPENFPDELRNDEQPKEEVKE